MSQGAPPTQRPQDGRLVANRYRLLSVVGRGGMGTVWRATDEVLGRDVAVKEVIVRVELADAERDIMLNRTLREARATARLNHPGIVTVHDVVEEDGRPWIVMEFVAARSLQQIIDQDGPQPPRRAAELGRQTLAALRAAHAVGILHRDVKPANVLVTTEGRAVLTDFGIAQVEGDAALTHTGLIMGSPAYISPERVEGERATAAADLWALGATIYATCEGRPPHPHTGAMSVFAAILTQDPPYPHKAGPLAPALQALLHRDPLQRMDAAAAAEVLSQVAQGAGPDAHTARIRRQAPQGAYVQQPWAQSETAGAGGPVRKRPKSNARLLAMTGGIIAVVVVLAAVLLLGRHGRALSHGAAASKTSGSGYTPASPAGSGPPAPQPAAGASTAPVPAGWHRAQALGASIGVSSGWRRSEQGVTVFWREPGSDAYVQMDRIAWTGKPYAAWLQWESEVQAKQSLQSYRRIDLRQVTGVPYEAAEIEFTWKGRAGVPMHGVDRRVLAGGRRYTVFVALPAGRWASSQDQVHGFLDSFAP
jgi:tRNA A-37 threonylcarbamoyl transferase component Bud32